MSEARESREKSSLLSTPIADMKPWDFWASAYAIGLPAEDAEAMRCGNPLPEQIDRAEKLGEMAKHALIAAQCGQPYRRPS